MKNKQNTKKTKFITCQTDFHSMDKVELYDDWTIKVWFKSGEIKIIDFKKIKKEFPSYTDLTLELFLKPREIRDTFIFWDDLYDIMSSLLWYTGETIENKVSSMKIQAMASVKIADGTIINIADAKGAERHKSPHLIFIGTDGSEVQLYFIDKNKNIGYNETKSGKGNVIRKLTETGKQLLIDYDEDFLTVWNSFEFGYKDANSVAKEFLHHFTPMTCKDIMKSKNVNVVITQMVRDEIARLITEWGKKSMTNAQPLIKQASKLIAETDIDDYKIKQARKLIAQLDKKADWYYDVSQHALCQNIIRLLENYTWNSNIREALKLFLEVVKHEIIA